MSDFLSDLRGGLRSLRLRHLGAQVLRREVGVLHRHGHRGVAEEALEELALDEDQPNLILLDLVMPLMNG